MPTPFAAVQTAGRAATTVPHSRMPTDRREWRCTRCRRLLGIIDGDRLHIRFGRGHDYIVALPVHCTCRGCRTLNRLSKLHA